MRFTLLDTTEFEAGSHDSSKASLAVFVDQNNQLLGSDASDSAEANTLQAVLDKDMLKKANGSTCLAPLLDSSLASHLLVIRATEADNPEQRQKLANATGKAVGALPGKVCYLDASHLVDLHAELPQLIVTAICKASYRFHEFKSVKKTVPSLEQVTLLQGAIDLSVALKRGEAIGRAVNLTRTLGNRPGNHCTPSHLADEALALAEGYSELSTEIREEAELKQMGMGAFLSVTAGTSEPAKLIELHYRGGSSKDKPLVLIGKGVTFDSGGISLKPGAGMDEMKFDMCGAATVFGVMQAVAELGLPLNVTGLIAAAENMPAGNATKPGDIVTSMSGKTIEILNTDAEGRLVLCDTLTYAQEMDPALMIDMATLTGACIVALGAHAQALYSNSDELADALLDAGTQMHDRAWRMPLWKDYTKQLESRFADYGNIGGSKAGSVTAACFLQEFVEGVDWAHLDIAGTAWLQGANKGATGRPVELLVRFLLDRAV